MSHAVIIKNAVKKYGDFTALNRVSLDIKQGRIFYPFRAVRMRKNHPDPCTQRAVPAVLSG